MTKLIEEFYSVHSDRSNERLVCLNKIITISKINLLENWITLASILFMKVETKRIC